MECAIECFRKKDYGLETGCFWVGEGNSLGQILEDDVVQCYSMILGDQLEMLLLLM